MSVLPGLIPRLPPAVTHLGLAPLSWMLTVEPARKGPTRPEPKPVVLLMLIVNEVCHLQRED